LTATGSTALLYWPLKRARLHPYVQLTGIKPSAPSVAPIHLGPKVNVAGGVPKIQYSRKAGKAGDHKDVRS
jgi:hypothetical protein